MKDFFRDYFTFNKRERNGIIVLVSIIGLLILFLNISGMFFREEKTDFTKFENEIEAFNAHADTSEAVRSPANDRAAEDAAEPTAAERFDFNPNGLPEKDWKRLGLSEKQIRSIKNYESKGGRFRSKADVKKMYSISAGLFQSLEPYIRIPEENKPVPVSFKIPELRQESVIELNGADSVQLMTIKGIGAFYSKMIIRYRNALGGFYDKRQLLEVWKFDREKLDAIEKYVTVDASKIKKVDINSCDASDLKSPYIRWNLANAIVNYRKMHGKYTSVEEIKKTDLLDEETYRKIVNYLKAE